MLKNSQFSALFIISVDRLHPYARIALNVNYFFDIMSTKSIVLAALTSVSICGSVNADFVGLNIGANYWTPDLKGSFASTAAGSTSINLNSDLGYSDHSSTSLNISLEHPVPLLPNVRYSGSDLSGYFI